MQRELVHTGIWLQSRRYKNQAAEHDAQSPTFDWREALARTCRVGPGQGTLHNAVQMSQTSRPA